MNNNFPFSSKKNSTDNNPFNSRSLANFVTLAAPLNQVSSERSAGTLLLFKIPSLCLFSVGGKIQNSLFFLLQIKNDISELKFTNSSKMKYLPFIVSQI